MISLREWKEKILSGGTRAALPIMTHPGIEIIGASVRNAVTDGEIHYRAVQALTRRYPAVASTLIMDLSVEAEAFGARIQFYDHDVPVVTSRRYPSGKHSSIFSDSGCLSGFN